MSITKKSDPIQLKGEIELKKLTPLAEKAFTESNVSELKRCFDIAVQEVTDLTKALDAMVHVMGMDDSKRLRLIGQQETDTSVNAIKSVALAAIDLAKAVATKSK